jgi:hypothetical protein
MWIVVVEAKRHWNKKTETRLYRWIPDVVTSDACREFEIRNIEIKNQQEQDPP